MTKQDQLVDEIQSLTRLITIAENLRDAKQAELDALPEEVITPDQF